VKKSELNARVPEDIRKMLLSDEQALLVVRQSRWKTLFTPDTIILTNRRLIRYSPYGLLGWRKDIEDYPYGDMANFKITRGIVLATITIGHRFMSESFVLEGLPRGIVNDVSKVVEENIRSARAGIVPPPGSSAFPQDALEVLKLRFARGEITKEQFEEMRRVLE
jgi:hypothetical protein